MTLAAQNQLAEVILRSDLPWAHVSSAGRTLQGRTRPVDVEVGFVIASDDRFLYSLPCAGIDTNLCISALKQISIVVDVIELTCLGFRPPSAARLYERLHHDACSSIRLLVDCSCAN